MNKKDIFIKEKLQQDKRISDEAEKIFNNFKEEFRLENKENIWCGDEYSDQVIYVDEPDYY